jgi:hypothetical protein
MEEKMARKKKKLTRKQRKQQRREAIARKRKEQSWEPRQAPSVRHDEVLEDMLPLFPRLGDASATSISAAEEFMMTLLASGYMADEPEFEEMMVDPMLCLDTFSEVVQELAIEPESLDELSDEDREDTQMRILEEVTQRLLTNELRQDIINGLNDLRLRLKQSGEREEAAKAAALQSFLGGDTGEEIWPMIGLVQAIFYRSLTVGFELIEASMEAMETVGPDESDVSLFEKLAQSSLAQKAEALLKKVPGLRGFMEKQADKIWEEGLHAMFTGELHLELYSPKEIGVGFEMLQTMFKDDIAERRETQDLRPLEMSQEKGKALISQVGSYITELFTPERLDQLRVRLNTILADPVYPKKWLAFLYMLAEYMAAEDAVEHEKHVLITSFIGEMGVAVKRNDNGWRLR